MKMETNENPTPTRKSTPVKKEPFILGNERPEQDKVPKFIAGLYSGFGKSLGQDDVREKFLGVSTQKKEITITVRIGEKIVTRTTNTTELNALSIIPAFYAGRHVMALMLRDLGLGFGGEL